MRLGISHVLSHETPEQWAQDLRALVGALALIVAVVMFVAFFILLAGLKTVRPNEALVLTLFLLVAGVCTALILWQGRRVLRTILRGEPFSAENAVSLRRAA